MAAPNVQNFLWKVSLVESHFSKVTKQAPVTLLKMSACDYKVLSWSLIEKPCCIVFQNLLLTWAPKSSYPENPQRKVHKESSFEVPPHGRIEAVSKNFPRSAGKVLCWHLFFNKVKSCSLVTFSKRGSGTDFFQ